MKTNGKEGAGGILMRESPRVHSLREITITYEGRDEQIVVKPPDLSVRGMFVNTSQRFAEGTVLNVRFRLELTDAVVQTRCEVRYCLPGVGVGVEFIGIAPEAARIIEKEIALNRSRAPKTTSRRAPARPLRKKRQR